MARARCFRVSGGWYLLLAARVRILPRDAVLLPVAGRSKVAVLRNSERDFLGLRASRPQTRRSRAVLRSYLINHFRASRSLRAGAPAVPENRRLGFEG